MNEIAKQSARSEIQVQISFEGVVTVRVPKGIPEPLKKPLATNLALSAIMATTDHPDSRALDDDAFGDFSVSPDAVTIRENILESLWDDSRVDGVDGKWTAGKAVIKDTQS